MMSSCSLSCVTAAFTTSPLIDVTLCTLHSITKEAHLTDWCCAVNSPHTLLARLALPMSFFLQQLALHAHRHQPLYVEPLADVEAPHPIAPAHYLAHCARHQRRSVDACG